MTFTLNAIPEILFGAGRLAEIATRVEALAGKGANVLVVADPALNGLGMTGAVLDALTKAGFEAHLYEGFTGEPKTQDVDAAAAMAQSAGARLVIGLGGGSALDTAKLAACCAASGLSAAAYALCATPLPADHLPVIAVPTTAGTGSEVTSISVFADADGMKVWAWGPELKPSLAILDPQLSVPLPADMAAATGLDAIVHAIEASTNKHRTDGNDLYCHKAIALVAANLEAAVKNPNDLAARGAMLLASCYGGIGIDNCGTALAHNVSHAVANLSPIAHGRATGLAMLATMDWVMEGNRPAFAAVARAMGADDPVRAFDRLVRSSGVKVDLAGDGLDRVTPEELARHMAAPANAPMRKSTARYPADTELVRFAERFLTLR